MTELDTPWFIDQTLTTTMFCPWAKRDVTARFLTFGGHPTVFIGCDHAECSLACLSGAPAPAMASEAPANPEPAGTADTEGDPGGQTR